MKEIISKFNKKHILVLGDIMLDEFLIGDVNRINPEAPVPVLSVKNSIYKPGGAANVANNIVALDGKTTVIGRVGNDESKDKLINEFKKSKIKYELVIDKSIPTIRKIRSIAKNQQLLRVDFEQKKELEDKYIIQIIKNIRKANPDLLIISDYNKGFITKNLLEEIKKLNIKILCDFKPGHQELFKDVFLIKPNLKEAQELIGINGKSDEDIEMIGKELIKRFNSNVLITRSENGMSLFEKEGKIHHIPTKAMEVYDVTGAGDTVIATFGLSMLSGASLEESAIIANHAASIVVKKVGTATVTQKELINSLKSDFSKIVSLDELILIVQDYKLKGKKIIFTNGCFDILHTGHINLLKEAKKQGDILIVGLNSDSSVKKLKGSTRPINNEKDRQEIIAGLESTDYVIIFREDTPEKIISILKPDIHVKGGDYNPYDYTSMPEAKVVHSYGGKVHIVKFIEGKSTTKIIEKIDKGKKS